MNFPRAAGIAYEDSGAPSRAESSSDRRLTLVLALLLIAGTGALYARSLHNGFVNFDDPDYVTRNPHVLQGVSWSNVVWAFGTDNPAANWHPLTWISHMLDVQWYGTKPAGHHFTNAAMHAINVAILFLLLVNGTGCVMRSAAAAALFAVHPLNVESVAWIAERKAVLCVLFLLLAVWAYGWYARRPSIGRYLFVMLFFTLGLMSKIMVIALPVGLLLLDYWPLRRLAPSEATDKGRANLSAFLILAIEKLPLLALSAAGAWMTLYVHHKQGTLAAAMPWSWRWRNVLDSYLTYVGKLAWPSRLAVFYPHPENSLPWWKAIVAGVVLAALSAIVWRFRAKKYLVTGWLWYLGTMVPMIGIVQSGRQGMADRYMYIPMLGLLVAAVWFLADQAATANLQPKIVAPVFAAWMLAYAYVTHTQIGYWKDSYTLFTHTLQVTRDNGIAENNLGTALMEKGEPQLAEAHFEAAVRLIPELASAHYDFGVLLQKRNRISDAVREYRLAIATSSDSLEAAQAHNNLGILYLQTNDAASAMTELNAAIALNPNEQNSFIGRGLVELQTFQTDAAIVDFSHAAQIAPSPQACFWLGRALEGKGDYARAADAYTAALRLAPGLTDARSRLDAIREKAAR